MDSRERLPAAVDESQEIVTSKKVVLQLLKNKSCKSCQHYVSPINIGYGNITYGYCIHSSNVYPTTPSSDSFCDKWEKK